MFERYSFVAVTTANLDSARVFWSQGLGFPITQDKPGEFFMVDAGGLRLCVDLADGSAHKAPGNDPIIGLKVASIREAMVALNKKGIAVARGPVTTERGSYVELRDPDGRLVVVTEMD